MTPLEGGRTAFLSDVSRETLDRLQALVALLEKWNRTINLVSKGTIDAAWQRHIVDSAQIFEFGKTASSWVDLGSGGGFPGLVIAIIAAEKAPLLTLTLIESDQRKATFLRLASQNLGLRTRVISGRIETVTPLLADVVSARALAPLPLLCKYAAPHLAPHGRAIFLKGKAFEAETVEARRMWNFDLETHPSITDPSAIVLVLKGISHV